MQRLYSWLKKEFLSVFPAFVFFLITLNLLNFTEDLFLKRDNLSTNYNFYSIAIMAGIIAKTLIVINHVPFINLFPNRPLIYNILWKTFLYESSACLVRLFIRFSSYYSSKNFLDSLHDGLSQIDFKRFIAVQIWYLILFFVFTSALELVRVLGITKMRKLFFG